MNEEAETLSLTRKNFFDQIGQDFPKATQLFSDFIDDYKKAINWEKFINPKVKFHNLPFGLQKGMIERFLLLNDILLTIEKAKSKGFYYGITDIESLEIIVPYIDSTFTDIATFPTCTIAFISGISEAFKMLEEKITAKETSISTMKIIE